MSTFSSNRRRPQDGSKSKSRAQGKKSRELDGEQSLLKLRDKRPYLSRALQKCSNLKQNGGTKKGKGHVDK